MPVVSNFPKPTLTQTPTTAESSQKYLKIQWKLDKVKEILAPVYFQIFPKPTQTQPLNDPRKKLYQNAISNVKITHFYMIVHSLEASQEKIKRNKKKSIKFLLPVELYMKDRYFLTL